MHVIVSGHGRRRLQQRGISTEEMNLLLQHASSAISDRRCDLLTLGKRGEHELLERGVSRQVVDRVRRTALVLATDRAEVVTVLKLHGQSRRRYLRHY